MKREPVKSGFIKAMGWEEGTLEIQFSNEEVWQYMGVPPDLWEGLRIAESHGKFFHLHIKGQFAEVEVTAIQGLPSVGPT